MVWPPYNRQGLRLLPPPTPLVSACNFCLYRDSSHFVLCELSAITAQAAPGFLSSSCFQGWLFLTLRLCHLRWQLREEMPSLTNLPKLTPVPHCFIFSRAETIICSDLVLLLFPLLIISLPYYTGKSLWAWTVCLVLCCIPSASAVPGHSSCSINICRMNKGESKQR